MQTIMIIDDLSFCRELFALAIERHGYRVVMAGSGGEGLAMMRRARPDLLVLDAHMPPPDGLAVLEAIRGDAALRDLPVFLLTALEEREVILRAAQLGAQEYILKSQFVLDELLTRIHRQLDPAAAPADAAAAPHEVAGIIVAPT